MLPPAPTKHTQKHFVKSSETVLLIFSIFIMWQRSNNNLIQIFLLSLSCQYDKIKVQAQKILKGSTIFKQIIPPALFCPRETLYIKFNFEAKTTSDYVTAKHFHKDLELVVLVWYAHKLYYSNIHQLLYFQTQFSLSFTFDLDCQIIVKSSLFYCMKMILQVSMNILTKLDHYQI